MQKETQVLEETTQHVGTQHVGQEVPVTEEQQAEQQQDVPAEQHVEQQEAKEPSSEERNFAALRKAKDNAERAKDSAERERDAYFKKLQEIDQQQAAAKAAAPPKPELGDDDLAEGRHIKELRKEIESYKQQMYKTTVETRIKSNFPDFDSVVTTNTVEKLNMAYPELAATLSASGDLYNTAASAYTMIKKLGLYDGRDHESNRETVHKNSTKPRPLSSVSPQQGESPLSHANAFAQGLTPELKKKLAKEVADARRASY